MSFKQYKIRDINKNPELHKEVFVLRDDAMEILNKFVEAAIKAGADSDKLMGMIDGDDNG